jgi:hypothetical protein
VTSACVVFFGLKSSESRSTRSSGTLTTLTFGAARPPEKPVSAWPPVSALKTVVLPLPGRPTMVTCIGQ